MFLIAVWFSIAPHVAIWVVIPIKLICDLSSIWTVSKWSCFSQLPVGFFCCLFWKKTFQDKWHRCHTDQMSLPSPNQKRQNTELYTTHWPWPVAWPHPFCVHHRTCDWKGIAALTPAPASVIVCSNAVTLAVPSTLWHCWLGVGKSIRPVKKLSDEVLSSLSVWSKLLMTWIWSSWRHCVPVISFFIRIQIGLTFLVLLTQVDLTKRPLNGVCPSVKTARHNAVTTVLCLTVFQPLFALLWFDNRRNSNSDKNEKLSYNSFAAVSSRQRQSVRYITTCCDDWVLFFT